MKSSYSLPDLSPTKRNDEAYKQRKVQGKYLLSSDSSIALLIFSLFNAILESDDIVGFYDSNYKSAPNKSPIKTRKETLVLLKKHDWQHFEKTYGLRLNSKDKIVIKIFFNIETYRY